MARKVKNPKWGTRQLGDGGRWPWGPIFAADGFDATIPVKGRWQHWKNVILGKGVMRNLGVARVVYDYGGLSNQSAIVIYAHTQVTNSAQNEGAAPRGALMLDLEAAEQLAAMLLGAIHAERTLS